MMFFLQDSHQSGCSYWKFYSQPLITKFILNWFTPFQQFSIILAEVQAEST